MNDRKYDEATARTIFEMMVWKLGESCVIREGGIFLNEEFRALSPRDTVFDWTPAYDMDWPGAPNPMTAPLLPIPFTANELAACMLDGPGWGIQEALDRRIGFPLDEEDLKGFSLRGRWARDALREAYALAEKAQIQVGEFDYNEAQQSSELLGQLEDAEDAANTREGVFENGITRDEANLRRARAVASVATLQAQALQMETVVAEKRAAWRKAMVGQLIGPETQPGPLARRLEAMQSDEYRQAEMEYEAATLRESEAKKALVRREALLSSPETLGGIAGLQAAEAAVDAATREVEDARHAIRIMRGDFLETNPPTAIVQSDSIDGTDSSLLAIPDTKMQDMVMEGLEPTTYSKDGADAAFVLGFYGVTLTSKIEHWAAMAEVQPLEAARLLCGEDPFNIQAYADSVEVRMLTRIFEDRARNHPACHALRDWALVALESGVPHREGISKAVVYLSANTVTTTHAAPMVKSDSTAPEVEPNFPWWRTAYDIFEMAQNIGAKRHSGQARPSNSAIAKEIAMRISDMERSKGRDRNAPNHDTIRGVLTGWKWRPQ